MKTTATLALMITALVAALILSGGTGQWSKSPGVVRDPARGSAEESITGQDVEDVAGAGPDRKREDVRPGFADQEGSKAPGDPGAEPWVEVDLVLVNEACAEPAPFVLLTLTDARGRVTFGTTDRLGRLQTRSPLAPGIVQVAGPRHLNRSRLLSARQGETVFFKSDDITEPEGSFYLQATGDSKAPVEPALCLLDLPRRVPLRLTVLTPDEPVPPGSLKDLHFFGADSSSPSSVEFVVQRAEELAPTLASKIQGATHVLELKRDPDTNAAELAWAPSGAADLNPRRQLEVYAVVDGSLFGAKLNVARIPNLGESPIDAKLEPAELSSIRLTDPARRFAELLPKRMEVAQALKERLERQPQALNVVVRSASGTYGGAVSVRATPTSAARAAFSKTSAQHLRKQWIDASFTQGDSGALEAAVRLDALDPVEYEIRAISLDGQPCKAQPVRITVPLAHSEPVQLLLLDR